MSSWISSNLRVYPGSAMEEIMKDPEVFPQEPGLKRSKDPAPFVSSNSRNEDFLFDEDGLREEERESGVSRTGGDLERRLIEALWRDDRIQLVSLVQQAREKSSAEVNLEDGGSECRETLHPVLAAKLLHLACKLDSVECARVLIEGDIEAAVRINDVDGSGRTPLHDAAEAHSTKCIDLLLRQKARTDLRSKDEESLLALDIALCSKRMQIEWFPSQSVEELLLRLSQRDLSSIKLLAEETRDVAAVALSNALAGRAIALAALLIVAADKVVRSSAKASLTIYDFVLDNAIALRHPPKVPSSGRWLGDEWRDDLQETRYEKRFALLREIELLHVFGGFSHSKAMTPLLRASRACDETIIGLLLKKDVNVNETDTDGNAALHWCLMECSTQKDPRVLCLLLKNGASASQRNNLGFTVVHFAAYKGNYEALQILLLHSPGSVDISSEMGETPLFLAVKNDFICCVKLLLRCGASSHFMNIQRLRPIDVAKSEEVRLLLSPANEGLRNKNILMGALNNNVTPRRKTAHSLPFSNHSDEEILNEDENIRSKTLLSSSHQHAKQGLCRCFDSSPRCVGDARCKYAPGDIEIKRLQNSSLETKHGWFKSPTKHRTRIHDDDLCRKVFVGGLPPLVDSDYLKEFFEAEFGAVEEAVVIGAQTRHHVVSRGFGFVTFKGEEAFAAAIEAQFVSIYNKRVEIKRAFAKSILLAGICKFLGHTDPADQQTMIPDDISAVDLNNEQILPPWVSKFKNWLPDYLKEACKRLPEGEWYPLSSLKGDFRATCGMELDHASLGYPKLKDFVRALPGTCQMRVVPTGNGPATHMVLLPFPSRLVYETVPPPPDQQAQLHTSPGVHGLSMDYHRHETPAFTMHRSLESLQSADLSESAKSWLAKKLNSKIGCIAHGDSAERKSNNREVGDFVPGLGKPVELFGFDWARLQEWSSYAQGAGGSRLPPQHAANLNNAQNRPPFSYFSREWCDYPNSPQLPSTTNNSEASVSEASVSEASVPTANQVQLSSKLCAVCQKEEGTLALIPCYHRVCAACSQNQYPSKCAICGTAVDPGYPPLGTCMEKESLRHKRSFPGR